MSGGAEAGAQVRMAGGAEAGAQVRLAGGAEAGAQVRMAGGVEAGALCEAVKSRPHLRACSHGVDQIAERAPSNLPTLFMSQCSPRVGAGRRWEVASHSGRLRIRA